MHIFVIFSGIAWYVDSSQKRSFAKDSRGISDIFLVLKELLKNSARATVEAQQATPTDSQWDIMGYRGK